jgi:hypothetical protein
MLFFLKIYVGFIFLLLSTSVFSQTKDSSYIGSVKGIAKDSVYNSALQSATVAIYKVEDSVLLGYQLAGSSGEFNFKEIPVGIPLQIVISYSGFKSFKKVFSIPVDQKDMDLSMLNVQRSTDMLDEVTVEYIPPVRMNGDTLEFNANAFKLDKDAVVEDLLRKLPGVTVWGDGVIYVNGRQVNNLLVDGKPFFGGDSQVAIQNLPKNAIDKIQVYNQNQDVQNPLDSVIEVNIKLKADKKTGKFGKLGVGFGTRERFDADGSLNFYSPQTQFGIAGAANNVNKEASGMNTLMRQGTYKGSKVSVEYQPNFRVQGLSRPISGGFNYQRDFIEKPQWRKKNFFSANYFIKNNETENVRSTQTETSFTGDSSRIQDDISVSNTTSNNHSLNMNYVDENERYNLNISPGFAWNTRNSNSEQNRNSTSSNQGLQSANNTVNSSTNDSKNMNVRIRFEAYKNPLINRRIPTDNFQTSYSLSTGKSIGEQQNNTDFISFINPAESKKYDRKYNTQTSNLNQSLTFSSGDLRQMIFGYGNFGGIVIRLKNNLNVNSSKETRVVADKDTTIKNYVINKSLSNDNKFSTVNEEPAISFEKIFKKELTNRYSKNLQMNVNAKWQFYSQHNSSVHDIQNIDRSYRRFTPEANINYNNNQIGDYRTNFRLSYNASSGYPSINQLAPLVDSSNLYNIRKGNLNLQPYDRRNFSFGIDHNSSKAKAMFGYNINVNAGYTNNSIVDSSIIDNLGRTTYYSVNADGNKYANIGGNVNKAFRIAEHQIQLNLKTSFGVSEDPNYINSVLNNSSNFNNTNGLDVYYTLKDLFAVNLGQTFTFFHSKQSGLNNREFGNAAKATTLSANYNFTKKLSLSSNITYNSTSSTNSKDIDFTIWNANVNYRFLKGNSGELKFSALDILHENISIINSGNNNSLTTGTANVLQNYYILTFSYFPRQFGNNRSGRRR